MPDSAARPYPAAPAADSPAPRHTLTVRVTHWITVACFLALLVSGCAIVISHPRFYWGETGNVGTSPLFAFHIPSSRATVPTGYNYVLPDQNGWSRYLHFQSAWIVVLTGLVYAVVSLLTGHFRRDLLPGSGLTFRALRPDPADARSYNPLQRTTYLFVIFALFPLVIWTGLAMSPAFVSAVPAAVTILGGRQSARTIHFFVSAALVLFLMVHVAMVWLAGFRSRVGAMITGRAAHQEDK
jgi:thiosulfate reductase cytochrome b subunit